MARLRSQCLTALLLFNFSVLAKSHLDFGQALFFTPVGNASQLKAIPVYFDSLIKRDDCDPSEYTECSGSCYDGANDSCCADGGACGSDHPICCGNDGCAPADGSVCCADGTNCAPENPICCGNGYCTVENGICCAEGSCGPGQVCGLCGTDPLCCSDASCTAYIGEDGSATAFQPDDCTPSPVPQNTIAPPGTVAAVGTIAQGSNTVVAATPSSTSSQTPTYTSNNPVFSATDTSTINQIQQTTTASPTEGITSGGSFGTSDISTSPFGLLPTASESVAGVASVAGATNNFDGRSAPIKTKIAFIIEAILLALF